MLVAGAVLAGGAGRRMGGVDKAALLVGGVPLLERVLAAARPVCDPVLVERQPGGGPVPAVQRALAHTPQADVLIVLAADLPFLRTEHLRALLGALGSAEAAAPTGPRGPNPLLAAYRRPSLASRAATLGPGDPARSLLPPGVASLDLGAAVFDINRPEDLAAADLLIAHTDHVIATVHWLRQLVASTVPDAAESVDEHRLVYRHAGAVPICTVVPRTGTVRLTFEHGTDIEVDAPARHLVELIHAALVRSAS